jgi:hypothetical protein
VAEPLTSGVKLVEDGLELRMQAGHPGSGNQ